MATIFHTSNSFIQFINIHQHIYIFGKIVKWHFFDFSILVQEKGECFASLCFWWAKPKAECPQVSPCWSYISVTARQNLISLDLQESFQGFSKTVASEFRFIRTTPCPVDLTLAIFGPKFWSILTIFLQRSQTALNRPESIPACFKTLETVISDPRRHIWAKISNV